MRYKIKTETMESFRKARAIATKDTHVFTVLERRHVLSTGDLSPEAREQLRRLGAQVGPDPQYQTG